MVELDGVPFILDFLPQEGPDDTRIHQFYEHLREGRLTTTRCSSSCTISSGIGSGLIPAPAII